MHRLAARGLPPGVDADIITRLDETNVEELRVCSGKNWFSMVELGLGNPWVMSCFSTLIVVKYVG